MSDWQQLVRQAKLQETLDSVIQSIKSNPKDAALRSYFIELLCIDGQLERADEQLMQATKLFPEFLAGASQIRHLVKAAQARVDFVQGGATANFLGSNEQQYATLTQLNLAIHEGNAEEVERLSEELESLRPETTLTINGTEYPDVRDIDDSLNGFIELYSSTGNYYLAPLDQVEYLNIKPASNLLETIWRPVEFSIKGITEGEAHIPLTYSRSDRDANKLGKETDWHPVVEDKVFVGHGQKVWLAGESALPLATIENIEKEKQEAEA
ncbi:putative virulence protein, SciE type [Vibrio nigripulchritudo SFn27]|uniref:Putative virulence protein, SciE type n=1 Tax=Vibrio nigripulchritudo TaxID=28173 RepID=U4JXB5_9VIBR|nr:type VI secretion system accessory protein TagJ [Vibrio nigripulchritudo]CCN85696.1 putative virulence protein, SciE type [Vibrio nigripulchritudo BLFn1]CCN86674.1 putative virulence protein, SciE type [Vibrio nigripulchritudo SFn27]CCN95961.1 putative virulence protein, SciE type [Vibrio nigripulchritudo ENn2]CCO43291.1 putative virulence protein, SciE type [Vibrio nigripulchritudo SFn135]CCO53714.1 putative virulence protein, SciE type [Vibrio nigripulchritudo Wn13]